MYLYASYDARLRQALVIHWWMFSFIYECIKYIWNLLCTNFYLTLPIHKVETTIIYIW